MLFALEFHFFNNDAFNKILSFFLWDDSQTGLNIKIKYFDNIPPEPNNKIVGSIPILLNSTKIHINNLILKIGLLNLDKFPWLIKLIVNNNSSLKCEDHLSALGGGFEHDAVDFYLSYVVFEDVSETVRGYLNQWVIFQSADENCGHCCLNSGLIRTDIGSLMKLKDNSFVDKSKHN